MKHLKWILSIASVLLLCLTIQAQNKPEWIDSVGIDGKANEWKGALHYFDKTSSARYGYANDAQNLYLAFMVVEPAGQMRIMRNGLNITLKTKLKPKVTGSLKLIGQKPDRETIEQMSQSRLNLDNPGKQRSERFDILKNLYLMAKPVVETTGFTKSKETLTSGEGGVVSFQIAWTPQNQMLIELKIPLNELFGENYALTTIAAKEISLSVEQAEEESHGRNFRMGMSGGGGMNGGQGGYGHGYGQGMHEGEDGESGASSRYGSYAPDKIEFKNSIVLAVGK
ncbi:MAG: hypothetical protein ACOYOT_00850 [Bacteroidales bacterium]